MNEQEIQAWQREFDHVEEKKEQRDKRVVNSLLKTMIDLGLIEKPKKRDKQ